MASTCFRCGMQYPDWNVHHCPAGVATGTSTPNVPVEVIEPPRDVTLLRIADALERIAAVMEYVPVLHIPEAVSEEGKP